MIYIFKASNEMGAYISTLGLLTYLLTHLLICPCNALVFYLKLVPGFRACFNMGSFFEPIFDRDRKVRIFLWTVPLMGLGC